MIQAQGSYSKKGGMRASIMPESSKSQREKGKMGAMDLDQNLVAFCIAYCSIYQHFVSYFPGNNLPAQCSQLSMCKTERK